MQILAGYHETPATSPGLRAVERFWSFRAQEAGSTLVLPDARCDIILRQCGRSGRLTPIITGPATRASTIPHDTGDAWIGARLRPHASAILWGAGMPSAPDRTLRGPQAVALCRPLSAMTGLDQSAFAALARTLTAQHVPDPRITRALDALHSSGDRLEQAALARRAGCSPRHLLRLFICQTGLPPKTHAQIIRFHRALRLSKDHGLPLPAAALESGYADQAHLSRACRRFGGFTPTARPTALTLPGLPG